MRIAVASMVLALLAVPGTHAGGVHDGPEPTPTDMFIHFAGDSTLPVDPVRPTGQALPPAPDATLCQGPLTWTAASNRAPYAYDGSDPTWVPGLVRDAEIASDRAPVLTWYLETVQPGTSDPADLPAPEVVVEATLRLGDTPDAFGKGQVLAQGASEPVLMHSQGDAEDAGVEGRHVYRFEVPMAWEAEATIPAADGFHLQIEARQAVDGCDGAPAGVRAHSGEATRPALRWHVFEPVRVDLLEARTGSSGTQVILHASSPWGAYDVLLGQASLQGPAGDTDLPAPEVLDVAGLGLGWRLGEDLPNGTYRIDAGVRNLQESAADETSAVFRIGTTEAARPPAQDATQGPGKDVPWPGAMPLLAVLWLLARRR